MGEAYDLETKRIELFGRIQALRDRNPDGNPVLLEMVTHAVDAAQNLRALQKAAADLEILKRTTR